jgi:hypothetical protein
MTNEERDKLEAKLRQYDLEIVPSWKVGVPYVDARLVAEILEGLGVIKPVEVEVKKP